MAILGIGLNPLTAAVGSLAAAVACEFTVVLPDAKRQRGRPRHRSVPLAAAASATGYGVLAVSGVTGDRKRFVRGRSLSVRLDLGCRRVIRKNKTGMTDT